MKPIKKFIVVEASGKTLFSEALSKAIKELQSSESDVDVEVTNLSTTGVGGVLSSITYSAVVVSRSNNLSGNKLM